VGFLELIGARRRGSSSNRLLSLLSLAPTAAALAVAMWALPARGAAATSPRPTDLRCTEGCAGRQTAAVGSAIRVTGAGLNNVVEVDFRGATGWIAAQPAVAGRHRLVVDIPSGAGTGRPRVVARDGDAAGVPKLLRIVSRARLPDRDSFRLLDAHLTPKRGFVDDGRTYRLRYRFRAYGSRAVRVTLLRSGRVLRRWKARDLLPYTAHRLRWKGTLSHGRPAPRGHYRFKITSPDHRPVLTSRIRLLGGKFPVRGRHDYGGPVQRFGAPRSRGRVHQGQDVFAPCGMRVAAARGGHVQARGTDPVLYGNWVVIDARGTRTDYRYAHFRHPASVHDGDRVRTGDEVGRIGRTGNARSVGCMLHFEVWPHGWNHGRPIDPLPILRRWDRWS
jgi:murein DD-endopeptidase MepM/ murein hydrolase activator NlpD